MLAHVTIELEIETRDYNGVRATEGSVKNLILDMLKRPALADLPVIDRRDITVYLCKEKE